MFVVNAVRHWWAGDATPAAQPETAPLLNPVQPADPEKATRETSGTGGIGAFATLIAAAQAYQAVTEEKKGSINQPQSAAAPQEEAAEVAADSKGAAGSWWSKFSLSAGVALSALGAVSALVHACLPRESVSAALLATTLMKIGFATPSAALAAREYYTEDEKDKSMLSARFVEIGLLLTAAALPWAQTPATDAVGSMLSAAAPIVLGFTMGESTHILRRISMALCACASAAAAGVSLGGEPDRLNIANATLSGAYLFYGGAPSSPMGWTQAAGLMTTLVAAAVTLGVGSAAMPAASAGITLAILDLLAVSVNAQMLQAQSDKEKAATPAPSMPSPV